MSSKIKARIKPRNEGIKVVNSETLRRLNEASIANGYNRSISDEGIEKLDPKGRHVLSFVMVHHHAYMVPVAPHYRVSVLMRMKKSDEPAFVVLDLPIKAWDNLPKGY